jgi:hypothetical protein
MVMVQKLFETRALTLLPPGTESGFRSGLPSVARAGATITSTTNTIIISVIITIMREAGKSLQQLARVSYILGHALRHLNVRTSHDTELDLRDK